mgnify:CR=1 FL=1
MRYEGAVYRPPSEAGSLIIQLTIGCARNTCRFCSMFKDKKFRVRKLEDVVADLKEMREYYKDYLIRRIFLADGDALICKTEDLLYIMGVINELFPERERITMYGAPKDVLLKSHEELVKLREAGLEMVYVGAESGDDEVLEYVKKGAQVVIDGRIGQNKWTDKATGNERENFLIIANNIRLLGSKRDIEQI